MVQPVGLSENGAGRREKEPRCEQDSGALDVDTFPGNLIHSLYYTLWLSTGLYKMTL